MIQKLQFGLLCLALLSLSLSATIKAVRGTSFIFPSLHQKVVKAVSNENISTWFHKDDSNEGSHEIYLTHVMGKFKCNNKACTKGGWNSKMRCVDSKQPGTHILDINSYVDRVAYRRKKWAGVAMEQQCYDPEEGSPHERDLCEGCKRGVCRQTNVRD
ncbi:uncharacterized protein BDZ99DRAFT_487563 [Mytilinidion resinicola]|uniref:3CxxC-type domain-containing protein n=1 Tax=Mytilinidion resinicola TaxID=574789 RepID=A0A6A6YPI2_9PEZI|nr:uncharacterized protein BDZ99DRAFT_487563 [Mytilinidion resinicola]KAF2810661.1 hypothetical protein BDZ99DRAFT_487563 [Mytilinidion resinicola]